MTGSRLRVSLVHERFTEYAGSEAVVEQLAQVWGAAPILAPIGRQSALPVELRARVQTTGLSRLLRGASYAHLLPLLPLAMRRLPVPDCDVVVASHHAFATQVVHATRAPVIAYVHSPARWVWDKTMRAGEKGGAVGALGLGAFAAAFRRLDLRAASEAHTLVANSSAVASRIREWWKRDSVVVHPPVDTDFYVPDVSVPREDFFLLAGRLVPYKRPDLAIRAAMRASVPLVVAGDGRVRHELERLAGPKVHFLGRVSDRELRDLYRRCRALLMPGIEDFGIVPVEAQACGAPVIAIDAGGVQDSVLPDVTGQLVQPSVATVEVELWANALAAFNDGDLNPAEIRVHAESFGRRRFREAMQSLVAETVG